MWRKGELSRAGTDTSVKYFKHTITTTCWPATVTQTRISLCVLVPLPGKSSGFKELLLLVSTSILIFFLSTSCVCFQNSCPTARTWLVRKAAQWHQEAPCATVRAAMRSVRMEQSVKVSPVHAWLTSVLQTRTERSRVKICTSGQQKLSRYYTKHFTFLHWLFSINIFKV